MSSVSTNIDGMEAGMERGGRREWGSGGRQGWGDRGGEKREAGDGRDEEGRM